MHQQPAATRLATPVPGYAATIWLSPDGEHFFLAVATAEGGRQHQLPATEAGLRKLQQVLKVLAKPAKAAGPAKPSGIDLWKQQKEHHQKEHKLTAVNSCIFCKGEARDKRMQARQFLPGQVIESKKLGVGKDAVSVRRLAPTSSQLSASSADFNMEELGL